MTIARNRHVVLPGWPGRPPAESLATARQARRMGYGAAWIGETSGLDAGALAGRVAGACPGMPLVLGPLPAPLRSGPQLAMLVSSLEAFGSPTEVVLGASQPLVTDGWHGRGTTDGALLRDLVEVTRAAAAGDRTDHAGLAPSHGFKLRLPARRVAVGLAALGPRRLELAGEIADRVVLNMVPPQLLPGMLDRVATGAARAGRPVPPVTAWVIAGVDPSAAAVVALRRFVAAYAGAGGYGDRFRDAGLDAQVDALSRPGRTSGGQADDALLAAVAALGRPDEVRARVERYEAAGVHVAIAPLTIDDPAGARTLRTLAPQPARATPHPARGGAPRAHRHHEDDHHSRLRPR